MSTCVAGVCAPVGSPGADSPSTSPPADALPPASSPPPPPSDTSIPPIASDPPPADSQPSPATPTSTQSPPPPPIHPKSTPNSSAKSSTPPPVLEWTSSSSSKSSNSPSSELSPVSMGVIAGAVVGGIAILAILGIFLICCSRKKRRDKVGPGPNGYYAAPPSGKDGNNSGHMQYYQHSGPPSSSSNLPPPPGYGFRPPPSDSYMSGGHSGGTTYNKGSDNSNSLRTISVGFSCSKSSFSYEELATATNGFSSANYLGQGGFGAVHKGVLKDGKEVAIKVLKADSGQGEREFQAEIDVISRVHHKHLVTLVGYCITGDQRMLVYEFVANKTLEFHLYGKGRPTMDWPTRLKIALGTAKGLAYLHEDCHPKIIHRDIKGANILIDNQFEAKVADFGLAKFTEDTNTHVSTRVMGTFGYLAPEYASSGKLTEKSDVFSFGVMLLEFITGRRPVDRTKSYSDDSLVDWARPYLAKAMEDGNFEALVDPKLQNNYNHGEMASMVACAAGATSHSAKRRPKMSQIVRALDSSISLSDMNEGMGQGESRAFAGAQYKEEMKRFKKMVLQDNASSEYTATSEYSGAQTESTVGTHTAQEMEMAMVKEGGRI